MTNEYSILPLFSTPLFVGYLNVDIKLVLDKIINLNYEKYTDSGSGSKNQKVLKIRELSFLKKEVDKAFDTYLHKILMYQKKSGFSFIHENSWANLHDKNEYSKEHIHQNSMYSFVFYVEVNENSGDIIFSSQKKSTFGFNAFNIPISSYNIYNSGEWAITPKNNMIIIFPSHLSHRVNPNESEKCRYSISGNYFCRGLIDERTTRIIF